MAPSDEPWIEIRRFDDPLEAELVRDFLRDHGVRVSVRGNAGTTAVLNRFSTVIDIRLDVPRAELDVAREALAAMNVGDAGESPFRGLVPATKTDAERYVAPKRPRVAMMLGLLVPIGAAHFHARHGAAGGVICAGVVGALLGILLFGRVELAIAWGILVVADVLGAPAAVRRFNAGRVPPEGIQRLYALGTLVLAFGVALAVGR
jgi:hypothetical protein